MVCFSQLKGQLILKIKNVRDDILRRAKYKKSEYDNLPSVVCEFYHCNKDILSVRNGIQTPARFIPRKNIEDKFISGLKTAAHFLLTCPM